MSRIAFQLGGLSVYWYGLLLAFALLLGTLLAMARERRFGLKRDTALDFALIAAPISVVCARLYYVAFTWDLFRDAPWQIVNLREGGLAIYGAVLSGLLTAVVYARVRRVRLGTLCDLCAPSLVLGQAIGRWGNFFNQEAYGGLIAAPALRFFPLGVYIEELSEWHYATFFYESSWCLLIFVLLMIGERKRFFTRSGDEFFAYAALYAIERAVVEGLRADSLMLLDIRVSQWLSGLALLLIALCWFIRAPKKTAKWFIPLLIALVGLFLAFRSGIFAVQLLFALMTLMLILPLYKTIQSTQI